MSSIEQYYDENPAREWARLERHRTEFAVTMRALADYLPPPPADIIDIGGGPGRYAIALAQQGYHVTLVDLAAQNLVFAQEKAQETGVALAGRSIISTTARTAGACSPRADACSDLLHCFLPPGSRAMPPSATLPAVSQRGSSTSVNR